MKVAPSSTAAQHLENGWDGVSNKSVREAFALDSWSLTFRDKSLEAEYMLVHTKIMRSPSRIFAFPLFVVVSVMMGLVSVLIPQWESPGTFFWVILSGALLAPLSFTGVLLRSRPTFNFKQFLSVTEVALAAYLCLVVWTPGFQHWVGACERTDLLKANCWMIRNDSAPFPALLVATMTPMILTTICGMQWLPCCVITVLVNCPAFYYLMVFQSTYVRSTCATTFVVASFCGIFMAHMTTRMERETFVWRKVALSETKVELERTFNAFLCHEIRNPFAVIKGFAECLTDVSISDRLADHMQFIHHIMNSCTHIQRILDNSLDLGKLEQHSLVLEDEVVNIKAVCDEIYSMMSVRVKPGVQLVTTCPDLSFQGDRTRWLQLLLNLVSNAVKFTQSGFVRLDITLKEILPAPEKTSGTRASKQLLVRVSDSGCGISKEGQAVLFQKYQQVHQGRFPNTVTDGGAGMAGPNKNTDSGTGLGLVISQHLVFLMGSQSGISVQSPICEGGDSKAGTVFSFCVEPKDLQFCSDGSPSPPSRDQHSPNVDQAEIELMPLSSIRKHARATIMVVDDEHLNRMVLCSKLRQCEQEINNRLGATGSDTKVHGSTSGVQHASACRFSMDVVQAEHAEMALDLMRARVEVRQKQKAKTALSASMPRSSTEQYEDDCDVYIIFLDQHMESSGGVLKGTDALPRFRQLAQRYAERQPVIVLTSGNCSTADQQRYTEMGADFAWPKPYPTSDVIAASISQWIRDRQPATF